MLEAIEPHKFFNELAAKVAEDEIAKQRRIIEDVTRRHMDFARVLNVATEEYLKTGIGREPDLKWVGWVEYGERSQFTWEGYFSKLAQHLKRPLVHVTNYGHLTLTKRAYTQPLWASLMLTAVERKSEYGVRRIPEGKPADVSYRLTGDRAYFYFHGDLGHKLLKSWLEQCETDPEFRKALRIPENNIE